MAANYKSLRLLSKQRGFTLVELIAVIVILSIVGTLSTSFVISASESYRSTQARAVIVNTARQALERMTRQLRGALPFSVRITNGGNCVEFMPIAAGGNYLQLVADLENGATAQSQINVSPYSLDFGVPRYVSVGAMSADEIYGVGNSRATYSSSSTLVQVVLSAPKQWQRNSVNRRFYLLDNPQAFCLIGSELRFYENIDVTGANVDLSGANHLLATNISSAQPFQLAPSGENRNITLTIALSFTHGGESIAFTQGVSIRNVP